MKKSLLYILGFLPVVALAQVDRSKAPAPAPAPAIKIAQPATYTLPNGLRVFVVTNRKIPQVSATLTLDMDGIVEGDKTGVSSLAGELMRRGTKTMNKAQLDEAIDFLGATVGTSGMSASASSLKNNFPKVFALLSDMILRPSFPATELEKARTQSLSALQQQKDNPSAIATNVANRLAYGKDHPYGDIETEASLKSITVPDVRNYVNTYWKPNNAFLVFVGDISAAEAKTLTDKYFGAWKRGTVRKQEYALPKAPAKTFIALVDRPASVQSQIEFIAPVELRPGTPDAIPVSVMSNILGGGFSGRLFASLREKYGFTYGAYSNISPNRLVGSFTATASVRNEKTDSALGAFVYEFNRIRGEAIGDTEVTRMKNYLSGSFARSLESPGTIAQFALNIARNKLPADYYQTYLQRLAGVSPDAVTSMANKYVQPGNLVVVIVGNAKQIAPGLEKYGEVRYFDVYGNPVAAPAASRKADASLTAQSVLQKAADAVAKPEAMSALKDVVINGSLGVMGQALDVSEKIIVPGTYSMDISAGGQLFQRQQVKNGKYVNTRQGQEQPAEESFKENLNAKAAFFEDAYLLKTPGYQFTLGDIEKVNGKDAVAVQVQGPSGKSNTHYYDLASGLRVKSVTEREAPGGQKALIQTFYSEYKTFNGVQIPTHVVIDQGQLKLELDRSDIKVNTGLKESDMQ
ncbi:M16 family metallopeptidase [Flaviaesturariibacter aridisoli]|uniref:Insulinase family protein n=1 Tax=Flaviaesturariibacter aridisoli TaxID=2545761 RepID=A0A4R4DTJ7_9BACT|nr:pitrilysin family protein [Flaviaesturariibacter aridisoli]TCZ63456.1 insulinase family protein [Flaviaesturariibacter aridisoli]